MHVLLVVEGVEKGSRDIANTFGNNPADGCCGDGIDQRFEGHKYGKSHANEAECLDVGVLFQADEADNGSRYGTEPNKDEQAPAPVTLLAQGNERQRRVRASDMPVNGCMVPFTKPFLPFGMMADRVVKGGGRVGAQHTKKVEDDTDACPVVVATKHPHQKNDAEDHTHQDAATVGH